MLHKKFEITVQYLPGSDFKIDKNGAIKNRLPKDIDFVEIVGYGIKWREGSVVEAKKSIDEYVRDLNSSHT